jgi:cellulose synthase/poly-beta-1,6-N-acetylglucosamine synthase-like glycosyltransferase
MTLCVSVVVPTCKRPDLVARCMAALLEQDLAPRDYEIIIVDDAACDATRQQVARWAIRAKICDQTVRYIPMDGTNSPHGPAAARNRGWRAAEGKIIAFTDDDCIPAPGWLRAGVAALKDDIVAVAGRLIVPLPDTPTDYEYNASQMAECDFVTANCFYRRDALVQIGGFDERFSAAWREDSDLIFTLQERGAQCTTAPQALVIHPVRPAQWGVSIHQQRKSMFNALLYKKHPTMYRQKIQAAPPWHYYGIIGTLLLILIGMLRKSSFLAFPGLLLWLWLTGRFCAQRLRHTSHAPGHITEMLVTSAIIPPLAVFWRVRGAIKFRVFFL